MKSRNYFIRTLVAATLAITCSWLAMPLHAADLSELLPIQIGQPVRLEVHPTSIQLTSPRQFRQLVVTAHYADGQLQDITRVAEFVSSNPQVAEVEKGIVRPRGDGTGELLVKAGGQEVKMAVQVTGQKSTEVVSFGYETLAALSKQGCNAGACHGSPSGKGGFRLSLRAFDAALDQVTLIREDFGRRTNVLDASESLLLLKPLMKVSHGGGRQIRKTDYAYGLLENWISEGCKLDPEKKARCVRIEVYPSSGRVLQRPAHTQQLSVLAHYSDGSIRDITPLAVYTSSDTEVALVDNGGLVVGQDRGQAAVIVRYLEFIESSFLTFVRDVEGYQW
ncbi:MAG: Ig-like domain-containing protein, partial [Pirellulaceae bacterium]